MSIRHMVVGRFMMLLTIMCFFWQVMQQSVLAQSLPDEDPGLGVLMLGDATDWMPAVLLETHIQAEINGPVASITLTQDFFNAHTGFAEASYLFPLPGQAAVYAMEIEIDGRRIVGSIEEKEEAERIYTEASNTGQQAAISQQLGTGVFRTKVANIAAGQSIKVRLQYRQIIEPENGLFSLTLPTTLTPRYSGRQVSSAALSAGVPIDLWNEQQWQPDIVSAASLPLENQNLFSLDMQLNAGLELASVTSVSHDIAVQQSQQFYAIKLADDYDLMDRDIIIQWELLATSQPQVVVLREQLDSSGESFGLLMLIPPKKDAALLATGSLPREVIFVLDRSGSMGGELIEQATSSVVYALQQLSPQDRFNIVDFSSDAARWASQTHMANASNIQAAIAYAEQLQAGGGTNIAEALQSALDLPVNTGWLRQVIFITDGAVSDEAGVLQMVTDQLGDARLFTVGIGYAPNSYFMRKAAELGRGTQHMINNQASVQPEMQSLLTQLRFPVLQDIDMQLPTDLVYEQYPARIPDLYFGEPLLLATRFDEWPEWVQMDGFDGQPWTQRMSLSSTQFNSPGIASLWAKAKINDLMDGRYQGISEEEIKPQVVELALQHQLLTEYTSFVAVEQKVVNPNPNATVKDSVANLMPRGVGLPVGGLGTHRWYLLAGIAWLLFMFSHVGWQRRQPTI